MRMLSVQFVIIILLLPILSMSQSTSNDEYKYKRYPQKQLITDEVISQVCENKGIESESLKIVSIRKDKDGVTHNKYSQSYKGLEVYGTTYIIHSKNDFVTSSNGYLASNIELSTSPQIDEAKAVSIAKKAMIGNKYFDDRVKPVELLVIDRAFPKVTSQYKLAYKVEVYTSDPIDKKIFFVDAMNGSIVLDLPGLIHESTPATAHTKYYGEQEIITESTTEGYYILQDLTRGDGITTLNYDMTTFRNATTTWDFTNGNQAEVALDAHFATERFYDMMLQRLDWDGLDGNGLSMNPIANAGDFVNAYWDGQNAWFGNGDCHRGPLTTLEVVGHEFMHGITDYTSYLIYNGESGAINESMSDIFGKALEYYITPLEFNWSIGESFIISEGFEPFRYMDNPHLKEMPAYYRGTYWNDFNGVHTNSSIGNLWFHILVEGKSDITENNESYNVAGVGMDKAIEIAWQAQSNYLTSTSTYFDYYQSTVDVATTMFGDESPELADVIEAWRAVGLHSDIEIEEEIIERDLSINIETSTQKYCLLDEFIPITVRITNNGITDILTSENIKFTIIIPNSSDLPLEITLEENILSGNSLYFELDNTFEITDIGYFYIEAFFNGLDDDNPGNNYSFSYVENFHPDNYNLTTGILNNNQNCYTDASQYQYFIRNNSCNAIPAGIEIRYFVEDYMNNEILLDETIVLNEELSIDQSFTIPIITDQKYNTVNVYAYTTTSTSDTIQEQIYFFESQREIEGAFLDPMDDIFATQDVLVLYNFSNNIEYNGNTYLANSGETNIENFFPCPDPLQDFKVTNYENGYAKISACLNLEEMENPYLKFDIVQFRDEGDLLPEYENLRCRAKVTWGDGDNEYIIIEGLTEGVEENISIPLPSNFVGDFSIEFISLTGIYFNGSNTNDYLLYDANLIRNLEIKNVNSTEEQRLAKEINITPNPGNGLYYVDSPYDISSIDIVSAQGKSITSLKDIETNTINLEMLSNGYYIMLINLKNGQQVSKPIINIKN